MKGERSVVIFKVNDGQKIQGKLQRSPDKLIVSNVVYDFYEARKLSKIGGRKLRLREPDFNIYSN